MALSRDLIIARATATLAATGLGGLSMRRLAQDLGVAPGALYHYVASKQDLLAAVGERILSGAPVGDLRPAEAAGVLRATLLEVRDGAEVISFVYAYRPEALAVFSRLLPDTVIRYVLGFVAVEQNRAELVRARIAEPDPAADSDASFSGGVRALLATPRP